MPAGHPLPPCPEATRVFECVLDTWLVKSPCVGGAWVRYPSRAAAGKGRAAIPLEVPGTWLNAPLGNAITSEERDWLRLGYIT